MLKKDDNEIYHCPVESCSHLGFTSKRGCRKHVTNIHPWYFCFDENPTRDINDQMALTSSNQDLEKKTCTISMPSYPVNSGVALEFSSWLTAICGGGGGGGVVVVWWWCGGGVVVVWWWCGGGVVVVWWWCGGGVVVVWFLNRNRYTQLLEQ